MSEKYRRVYVAVVAEFSTEGIIRPISFTWEDGIQYEIDRVIHIQKAASLKVGGHGLRYNVTVSGKDVYMFLDDSKWFMEGKQYN